MQIREQIVDRYGDERTYVLNVEEPSFEDLEEVAEFFAAWEVNA